MLDNTDENVLSLLQDVAVKGNKLAKILTMNAGKTGD